MKRTIIGIVIAASLVAVPANANHAPESQEAPLADGGLRQHESFKTNYYVYRSIGGETAVLGKEKKRRWWCVWLCKTRVAKKAEEIIVRNTYYAEVQPGVFASVVGDAVVCANASSCGDKHWAFGATIKIPFPGGGALDGLLPIDGVVTEHQVRINSETFTATTAVGKHPGPVIL